MRVTNKTMTQHYLNNMQTNLKSMQRFQNQMASGKEILRPSDDPFIAVRSMAMESAISKNEQYKKNIADAQGWLDMTDTSVQEMISIINRFKTQVVQAEDAFASDSFLNSVAQEMGQNIERFAQVGNTTYEGRYIFGGYATDKPPFEVDKSSGGLTLNSDLTINSNDASGNIDREVADGVSVTVNISPQKIMNGDEVNGIDSIGQTMQKIYNTIKRPQGTPSYADDGYATFEDQLSQATSELERHFTNVTAVLSEVGVKANRMESAYERNRSQNLSMTELLSKIEDIDYVEKAVMFSSQETTYNAALSVGGKLLQLSLINYLR